MMHCTLEQLPTIFEHSGLNVILSKYLNILPSKYNIFCYNEDDSYVFYIAEEKLKNIEEINSKEIIGNIQCVYDSDEEEMIIAWVSVNGDFMGKGISQFLILLACNIALKIFEINKVILDDDSDNAWKLDRNVYIKLGLVYINEEPNPEMEGNIRNIVSKWSRFRLRYTDKDRTLRDGKKFVPFFKLR